MFKNDLLIKGNMIAEFSIDNLFNEITIVSHKDGVFELGQPNNISSGNQKLLPAKYIINKNATILFWNDGTKTIVKRASEDEYNKALGFLWAYFQKASGLSKTKANEYIRGLLDEEELNALEILKGVNISETLGNIAEGISEGFKNLSKSFKQNSNNASITVPNLIGKNYKKYMK